MSNRRDNRGKGSGKRREGLLQVRVDDTEKAAFEDAASLSGLAVSAWVRDRLRSIAARELEAAARPVPFLKEVGK
jgi:predicted HicB family RNase H-like nuclease